MPPGFPLSPDSIVASKMIAHFVLLAQGQMSHGYVEKLRASGETAWTETLLHRFNVQFPDGEDARAPFAGRIISNGKLFGTTSEGEIHRLRGHSLAR